MPAIALSDCNDCNQKLTEDVLCGANLVIAPTYLYKTEHEKRDAYKKAEMAANNHAFVCNGVFAPNEKTIFSGGNLTYDQYYASIRSEIDFLYKNCPGAILFLLGFKTLAEAKYAVFAAKEVCDLPICVALDFQNETKLSDGFDAVTSVLTLQSLGVSAFGVIANDCDTTLDVILDIKEFTSVPLFAIPGGNAYITPVEYAQYAHDFVNNKCAMFGAGFGTDQRYTAQIAKELWQLEPFAPDFPTVYAVCGKSGICFFDFQNQPVGNKTNILEIDLEKFTKAEDVDAVIATLCDNGLPPVCFVTKDIEVLQRAVALYPGRACVKSDEYGEIIAKEYGAFVFAANEGEN